MGNKNTLSEEKAKILDRRLTQKFNIIYLSIRTSKICQLTFLKLFTSTEHVKESNGFHAMIYNNTIHTIGSVSRYPMKVAICRSDMNLTYDSGCIKFPNLNAISTRIITAK